MQDSQQNLHRGLEERHINLMALGAAIGVGLFLGSAKAIQMAGPAIMVSYALGGFAIFLIMRALGEMAIHDPVAGSFSRYAQNYLGPLAGYLTGWNYWFLWIVTCMAEITAVGVYMGVWFPGVSSWVWALSALVIMGSVNFIAVKAYGEFEFWFALIKIVTIVLMIISSLGMILFGFGNGGVATGIAHLWQHGGFMPNGVQGILMSMQMVMFAYLGVEMIGLTAGEAKNPRKTLARAVDSVFWRILIFYVGALFVVMSIYPWNEIGAQGSPFVMTFEKMGIPAAAGLINFVVLTAALSSCNSGIFSTGRMLYTLAHFGQAPRMFGEVSKQHVPAKAISVSVLLLLIGVGLNYLVPEEAFTYVTSVATVGAIWTWGVIMFAHMGYRKSVRLGESKPVSFRMPGGMFATGFVLLFLAAGTVMLAFDAGNRVALYVAPVWFGLLTVGYLLSKSSSAAGSTRLAAASAR